MGWDIRSYAATGHARAVKLMTSRNEWKRREIDGMLLVKNVRLLLETTSHL